MSFPAYPEYKNTEIPWMQRIPSSWQLLPFFSRFFERKESNKGMKSENLLSLSFGRIVRKDITTLEGLLPASFETYQVVHPGNIVFRLTDLQNDKRSLRSAIVNEKGIITSAYLAVSAKDFNPTFSNYLFRAYDLMKVFYSMGGGLRQSMKYDDMKWLPIVCPSINEQTQIARFLDHETAKIDALIREQERLIELLQEKRQAVISHAVTKGLDPDVPMKDSGVEWLGEVPAHWDRTLIKHCCYINDGNHGEEYPKGDDFVDDADIGVPFIRGGNLKDMTVTTEGMLYITAEKNRSMRKGRLQVGDILFVNRGEIGKLAVIPSSMNGANLNSQIAYLRVENRIIDPHYLVHYLASDTIKAEIKAAQEGSVLTQYPISDLAAIHVPVPPKDEQQKISTYLKEQLFSFNVLTSEASNSINLLSERRSALISAAVTGKIDVRNWQPPSDESAFDEEVRQAGMEATA
ncbi:restriction endonuclease subunit S [Marinobacter nauticus]|uniref:Restriction modification system DNA specificity domain n=1 Tax=Marinobacter nauticus (strain ATCC 700491 / DSM 11845 / VT8) TaxID=351348 RepID=A1TX70_MARN8|nr:restriction endonuclease subunit S [Marinobacter nauticus]ABM17339.1 restriction modification system DNA specificity domain [Marinobacter nauticus VT8]